MKKKERAMPLAMSILMPIIMCFIVNYNDPATQSTAQTPLINTIISAAVTMVLCMIITTFLPIGKLVRILAKKLNVKPPGFKFMACPFRFPSSTPCFSVRC